MRQLSYSLSSSFTLAATPYYAPITAPYWVENEIMQTWDQTTSLRTGRLALVFIAAMLSLVPSSDEYFQPLRRARNARGSAVGPEGGGSDDPWGGKSVRHILSFSSASRMCGVAFTVGFWSVGSAISYPTPPEVRGPDGGPALRPIKAEDMLRRKYATNVMRAILWLGMERTSPLPSTLHLHPPPLRLSPLPLSPPSLLQAST